MNPWEEAPQLGGEQRTKTPWEQDPMQMTNDQMMTRFDQRKAERDAIVPPYEESFGLGFQKGLAKPAINVGRALQSGAEYMGFDDAIEGVTSLLAGSKIPPPSEWQGMLDQHMAEQEQQGVVPSGGGVLAGEITGSLPAAFVPGGVLAQGAATGALLTNSDTFPGVAMDAGLGAVGGKVGETAMRGLSRVISPKIKQSVKTLLAEGVPLTPGQASGGVVKGVEDALTSLPIVGNIIKENQASSIAGLNEAAINRALKPIGKKLGKGIDLGRDAVAFAASTISKTYDDLLPGLSVKADKEFSDGIKQVLLMAEDLPEQQTKQLINFVKKDVIGRFSRGGGMSGQTMKHVESKLGGLIKRYGKSLDPDQKFLADGLKEAQSLLRQVTERSNPKYAGQLKAVNTAFANLARVEKAASSLGAESGVFSPSQLASAVRSGDNSGRKQAYARGKALMQDLSDAGREVLPSKVADSGTVTRGLTSAMALGAIEPTAAMSAAAASLPFSGVGSKALTGLLTKRPKGAPELAKMLLKYPQLQGILGGTLAVSGQ